MVAFFSFFPQIKCFLLCLSTASMVNRKAVFSISRLFHLNHTKSTFLLCFNVLSLVYFWVIWFGRCNWWTSRFLKDILVNLLYSCLSHPLLYVLYSCAPSHLLTQFSVHLKRRHFTNQLWCLSTIHCVNLQSGLEKDQLTHATN